MSTRSFKDYLKQKDQVRSQSANSQTTLTNINSSSNGTSWSDIDTLVKNYQESNALPPLLTPEIPKVYSETTPSYTEEQELVIPQLLSPTLPKKYVQANQPIKTEADNINVRNKRPLIKIQDEDDKDDDRNLERIGSNREKNALKRPDQNSDTSGNEKDPAFNSSTERHQTNNIPEKKRKVTTSASKKTERKTESKPANHPSDPAQSRRSQIPSKQNINTSNNLEDFLKLKDHYVKLAIEKKHKGDKLLDENMTLGVVYFIDCILLYLVGFSYEDESRRIGRKIYNDVPWLSLIAFIDSVIELTKEDRKYNDLLGFCLQVRLVVYEHIIKIVTEFIQMDQSKGKRSNKLEDKLSIADRITKHINNLFKYREASRKSLLTSEQYLSIFKLQEEYPSIIEEFQLQSERSNTAKTLIDPSNDKIQLPINSVTTINQIAAYGYKLIQLWCRKEKVRYTKWSA